MKTDPQLPPLGTSLLRLGLRLALVVVFVWAVVMLMHWVEGHIGRLPDEMGENLMLGFVITMLLAYAVLMATPFVPGIEIGISLLMMKGAEVAPFVYLATVSGLMLAFLAGRLLPDGWLYRLFADLRMRRACALMETIRPLDAEARLSRLRAALPAWAAPLSGHGRYALLALLLNIPGNGLLGGGGGICLVAGLSKLFALPGALLAIAIGVAPVPLMVWLFGAGAVF